MLEARGLVKSYGAVQAVRNADLLLEPGTVHALVGANGSGKSTVIKMLAGVVAPDQGTITVGGREVTIPTPEAARRLGIATSFQDLSLVPTLTAVENVMLATKRRRDEVLGVLKSYLQEFELEVDMDVPSEELSINRQMVLEALKAICQEPKVLILDEATAALDQGQADRLFRLVRRLTRERGVTVLVVTHRLREVLQHCDTVTVMRDGVTVARHRSEALTEGALAALIVGEEVELHRASQPGKPVAGSVMAEYRELAGRRKVSDVSLSVRQSEIVGIGGLQGQGQDELLRIAALLEPPQRGEARVYWQGGLRALRQGEARRAVLYISGDRASKAVFYGRSIVDNLFAQAYATSRMFSWVSPARLAEEAKAVLDVLGVRAHPERNIETLSGGNQQRVVFGRLLVGRPHLLVLDDPTLGVDVHSRHEIHRILREKGDIGTIIYSSDDEELVDLCDRVLVMFEGRKVQELRSGEVTVEKLGHAMLGRGGEGIRDEG